MDASLTILMIVSLTTQTDSDIDTNISIFPSSEYTQISPKATW